MGNRSAILLGVFVAAGAAIAIVVVATNPGDQATSSTAPNKAEDIAHTDVTETHAPADLTPWPVYRGNTAFQGVLDESLPDSLELAWTFTTGGPVKSSAVIGHGRAYIGSDDGHVYAIDLATGEADWRFETEGPVEAPPLIVGERIFIGSSDGNMYALDAHSGSEVWRFKTEGKILGSATFRVAAATDKDAEQPGVQIIFGSYDFNLYCVDEADGSLVWRYETDNYVHGSAALDGDRLVFGGCDMLLHIISAIDGQEIATVDLEAQITATVAIKDDHAFVGHYGNMLDCIDLNSREIVWSARDRNFPVFSSAAVNDDLVIFGTQGRRVMAVDRSDGSERWAFSARGHVDSSAVIGGDKVIFGSNDGRLYLLDIRDGAELWSYDLGQPITASPAVARGMVVIGCEDGNVYAFRAKQTTHES